MRVKEKVMMNRLVTARHLAAPTNQCHAQADNLVQTRLSLDQLCRFLLMAPSFLKMSGSTCGLTESSRSSDGLSILYLSSPCYQIPIPSALW